MFWKNVVLYEIYSKKLQWPNTSCMSLYAHTGRLAYGTITRTHCYCAMLQTTIVSNTWPNIIQIRSLFSFFFSGRLYLTNSKLVWLKNAIGTNAVINFKENVTSWRFARSPRKLILFVLEDIFWHLNSQCRLVILVLFDQRCSQAVIKHEILKYY